MKKIGFPWRFRNKHPKDVKELSKTAQKALLLRNAADTIELFGNLSLTSRVFATYLRFRAVSTGLRERHEGWYLTLN